LTGGGIAFALAGVDLSRISERSEIDEFKDLATPGWRHGAGPRDARDRRSPDLRLARRVGQSRAVVSGRSAKYDTLIDESAAFHGVDANLVRAVIQQESGFNPRATSRVGAMGLMQLMPTTAAELGVDDPYNPVQNIRAGVSYLKGLLVKFAHNVELALAAYNAGPGAVRKYGNVVPPYRETKDYVARITKTVNTTTAAMPPKPVTKIYKTIEIVDGHPVVKLTTAKPVDHAQGGPVANAQGRPRETPLVLTKSAQQ
jgi:hypothetical protein